MISGLNRTPLYALHCEAGARMVPFAGYEMPVQYRGGIIQEHLHTRRAASLFDVSHMGQIEISGPRVQEELERLIPLDLDDVSLSHMAYTVLPNAQGGVIDDLIISRRNRDNFVLVINAGCKSKVIAYLSQQLKVSPLHILEDHALLALQGPTAASTLMKVFPPEVSHLSFMEGMLVKFQRVECFVSRCGYTGEDGFEISVPSTQVENLARHLLALEDVQWAGLGARDSLRLEAGLCLYGHELTENTSPVAAGIGWTISRSRREGGQKAGHFPGCDVILPQLKTGPAKKRVGLMVQGRVPVREGAIVCDEQEREVGIVTSGGFSPSLSEPIAMAMLESAALKGATSFHSLVRGKPVYLKPCSLPFLPHRYHRNLP